MKRIGGFRRKSRSKMRIPIREKGKIKINRFLQTFSVGDKVLLKPYPSFHKGVFDLIFYGKIGNVIGTQGKCYKVEIKDRKKLKTLLVHPVHLLNS